ncbi:MAG TPA: hypothetical protein PLK80_00005 [bacterium]|mgnify:CR=1 FL=1|nr:MAG: hypothetical protein BWY28_03107 [bacterium ADurb.Bin236]HOY62872.1 hypothetical protein [bacterium]HPI75088.1 hypothetical protein [bacterium]HPN93060.1 hypothetical protein [bacterium]
MERKQRKTSFIKNITISVLWVTTPAAIAMILFREKLPPMFAEGFAEGFIAGVIFGNLNLLCVERLVKSLIGGADKRKTRTAVANAAALAAIVSGLLAGLYYKIFDGFGALAGFTVVLAVMMAQGMKQINKLKETEK